MWQKEVVWLVTKVWQNSMADVWIAATKPWQKDVAYVWFAATNE